MFIYVFSKEDAEKLKGSGMVLLSENHERSTYVFLFEPIRLSFSISDMRHVLTDTLTY